MYCCSPAHGHIDDQLAKGYRVLALLQNRRLIHRCISLLFNSIDGASMFASGHILEEWLLHLWYTHGDILKAQDKMGVQQLCRLLSVNTRKQLEVDGSTTALQWMRWGTGTSIKWETIGMIFAFVGVYAVTSLERKDDQTTSLMVWTSIMYRSLPRCVQDQSYVLISAAHVVRSTMSSSSSFTLFIACGSPPSSRALRIICFIG